jgi:hypothetical protein
MIPLLEMPHRFESCPPDSSRFQAAHEAHVAADAYPKSHRPKPLPCFECRGWHLYPAKVQAKGSEPVGEAHIGLVAAEGAKC